MRLALLAPDIIEAIVRGHVRLVNDPATAELREGEILAARQTDPGWIMLFPLAAGLLVERGSLLSHSAIVSREMGLPAIVSLPSLTDWVRTGDLVVTLGAGDVWKAGEELIRSCCGGGGRNARGRRSA